MNHLIIRVCEIALSSLSELQMENEVNFKKEMADFHTNPKVVQSATAINQVEYEFRKKQELLERRKYEVKDLMDIAYRKTI